MANSPNEFAENRQPKTGYLAVPLISSENRDYLPCSPQHADVISNNKIGVIVDPSRTAFAFLSSRAFTVWNKAVSGRLKSDLNISITTTYNNFPFPELSDNQRSELKTKSDAIVEARSQFPDSSLADLYDPNAMPLSLRKAHEELDKAVLRAFGMKASLSDNQLLTALFELHESQASTVS